MENTKNMLNNALNNHYAVPAFNINNLEWTRFILEECQNNNSPVILGVSEGAAKYMGGYKTVYAMVSALVSDLKITIPVALHLDHGSSFETCKTAIDAGFTSVMIDASKYELKENIAITKSVVDYARAHNVTVEAEVGHVGGVEDNVIADVAYAKVIDAVTIAKETGIDSLAPALGSVHGLYNGTPKLDFVRMEEIKNLIKMPLVLHGGTGIPDDMIVKGISCGICKLNLNTELQIAWTSAVYEFLKTHENVYDPRKVIKAGESAIKKVVRDKIILLGSNKAQ